MGYKYALAKVAFVCLCNSISILHMGMVGCGAVLVQTHAPKQVGLVSSIGEYADSENIDMRQLGNLVCDKWINLYFKFRPQCIQIIRSTLISQSCDLSPHCGHTVYQTLNSTFWSKIGICYGVGTEAKILVTNDNTKIFDSNWYKLCHFNLSHIENRYIFKDYLIYMGNEQYLAISEYFLDAFVIHNGDYYERQIPTSDTDGKFCFHTINDLQMVTIGPYPIDQMYYHSNIIVHLKGRHNGTRIIDYHTVYSMHNGWVYARYKIDLVNYQCYGAYQTTSIHYFTSVVGHIIFTAVVSLFDIFINLLYTILSPLGYITDPFIFVLIFLICLYKRYSLASSSVFAATISTSAVILRSVIFVDLTR